MRLAFLATATIALAACNQSRPAGDKQPPADSAVQDSGLGSNSAIDLSVVDPAAAKVVMNQRHKGMEDIGKAMKALSREMKSGSANMANVRTAAATIDKGAQSASGWFRQGTGPEIGKTGAKPEIWRKHADFTAKLEDFQTAARAMVNASADTDPASARTAFDNLGKSCKSCHENYRSKMKN